VAAMFVTGCGTVIETRGDSEICEIHHTYMRSAEFSPPSNDKPPAEEYLNARIRYFRHSYPSTLRPQFRTKYMIYLCDKCVQAEADWMRMHPEYKR
jgi:hypothetical protein